MNDIDFPKMFREEQVKSFVSRMREISQFEGHDNEIYHDEYIDVVLQEVEAAEADLSTARVAIEKYIISELAKDPSNVIFMKMHDGMYPIIQDVIDIEIKMFGSPKYVVSKANTTADAWRLDGGAEVPIHNINLPNDVLEEVKKYEFFTVKENNNLVLPDKPETITDERSKFFSALVTKEDGDVEANEKTWYDNFKNEEVYDFIDKLLYATNFHEQISFSLTKSLETYCLTGKLNNEFLRNEKALEYEQECEIPEVDIPPGEFIITARNSSLRALFTLLQISVDNFDTLAKNLREDEDLEAKKEQVVKVLVKLYGKHPIFKEDLKNIKLVFRIINEDQAKHFYVALNDWASFYEEHGFFKSAENCYILKEYLGTDKGYKESEKENTPIVTEVKKESKQENSLPAVANIFITD